MLGIEFIPGFLRPELRVMEESRRVDDEAQIQSLRCDLSGSFSDASLIGDVDGWLARTVEPDEVASRDVV